MQRRRRSSTRKRDLLRLGDFLGKALKKHRIDLNIADFEIFKIWREAVGPQIAVKTEPFKFKNGILFVRVSNSAWLQQLQFMKQEIIDRVNRAMSASGKQTLNGIFFSIGQIETAPLPHADSSTAEENTSVLGERDERLVEESIDAIGDGELKELVRRVMTKEIFNRRIRGDG